MNLITLEEYLMGRDKLAPLSEELHLNAMTMVDKANQLMKRFGSYRKVTSGYRPAEINEHVPGAASHSNHTICCAIDLEDRDGMLDRWCMQNQDTLASQGLWLESPTDTKGWTHLQSLPPRSGHRVFIA